MRMVPGRPVLRSSPAVCHALTRGNGTLRKGNCPVHGVCVELANSMEMKAGAIVDGDWEIVSQVDDDRVSPVNYDGWPWNCAVDSEGPS